MKPIRPILDFEMEVLKPKYSHEKKDLTIFT